MKPIQSASTHIGTILRQYVDLPGAVHILCLGTLINRAGALVLPFLALYIRQVAGFGTEFATTAIGAFGAGSLAASLVGGHLTDRIGRRIVMLGSLIGGAIIILIFSSLTSQWSILVGLFTFALVADMYRPAASAMISDLVEPERRPHAFGLMYVAINLGFSVGPVIAGVISQYSFQWLFWGDALTTSIYAGIIFFAIRETMPARSLDHSRSGLLSTPVTGPPSQAPASADSQAAESGLFDAVKDMLGNAPFIIFCLGMTLIALVFHQALSTLPLYIVELGISKALYGKIIAVNGLLIAVAQLPLTAFLTRFNRAAVIVAGAVLTAVGFGVTGIATTTAQFVGTIVIWTLGEMLQAPFSHSIVGDLAPAKYRGRYFGVFIMSFSGAMMVGPPIGGILLERYGPGVLWTTCFVVGLLAALLIASLWRRIGGDQAGRAEIAAGS